MNNLFNGNEITRELYNAPLILSVQDVARILGLSRPTVNRLLDSEEIAPFYLNGMRKIRKEDLIRWYNKDARDLT